MGARRLLGTLGDEGDAISKIHIAIGATEIAKSVEEYSRRLGCLPVVVIADEYALWRTATVNFSIRRVSGAPGTLRHLGWEDETASEFTKDTDANGIVWERFSAQLQAEEIRNAWPQSKYDGK